MLRALIISLLIISFAQAEESKKCDMSTIRAVQDVLACRGSLTFGTCAAVGPLALGAGVTAGVVAGKAAKEISYRSKYDPELWKEKVAIEKEMEKLKPAYDKVNQGIQDTYNKTKVNVTGVAADTQNRVMAESIQYQRLMSKDYQRYEELSRKLGGINATAEMRSSRAPVGSFIRKMILPGVGLVTGVGAVATVGVKLAEYIATATPVACADSAEKFKSLNADCKENFEDLSPSALKFLMSEEYEQQRALDTNYGLCEHYSRMLEHFKKSEEVTVSSLTCSSRGQPKTTIEVTTDDGKKLSHEIILGRDLQGKRTIDNIQTYDYVNKNSFRLFFSDVKKTSTTLTENYDVKDIQYFVPGGTSPAPSAVFSISKKPESEYFRGRHDRAVKIYYGMKNYLPQIVQCCEDKYPNTEVCNEKFVNAKFSGEKKSPTTSAK